MDLGLDKIISGIKVNKVNPYQTPNKSHGVMWSCGQSATSHISITSCVMWIPRSSRNLFRGHRSTKVLSCRQRRDLPSY